MKYIKNDSTNPFYNLALEEFVLTNLKEDDYVLLWQNDNTVVVGRHQHTLKEINTQWVEENKVNVVRRNSGGGAVYHDLGNLNFSYLTAYNKGADINYRRFLLPVIKALGRIGVKAEISGRNDMEIQGKKFSGNAQAIIKDRFLHHGTLLLNSDLSILSKVLNVPEDKIQSKSISSVKARVTNISEYLHHKIDIPQLKQLILDAFFEEKDFQEALLSEEQLDEVIRLQQTKYETWDWNYGKSPDANFTKRMKFQQGTVEVQMKIVKGTVRECKIWGDFLALCGVEEIERSLIGRRIHVSDITEALAQHDLKMFFGGIELDELKWVFL